MVKCQNRDPLRKRTESFPGSLASEISQIRHMPSSDLASFVSPNQHVRFIETGEKDPLMTYEKALITQSRCSDRPRAD